MQPFRSPNMAKDGRREQIAFWSQLPLGVTMDRMVLTGFVDRATYWELSRKGLH
jgi:hypothetical protein